MPIDEFSLNQAQGYLAELERLASQIEYARQVFGESLERYRQHASPDTEVDLQSSIAYFERFIQPIIIQQSVVDRQFSRPSEMLVLGIDQDWRAYEFRQLFQSIDYINKIYILRDKLRTEAPDLRLNREMTRSYVYHQAALYYYLAPNEELQVRSVHFASPGSVTFEGVAKAIQELKGLLVYILTFQFTKDFANLYDHFTLDRPIERTEKRMKLKELIRREQSQERRLAIQEMGEYKEFLQKMDEIADLAIQLERKGLARGIKVEEMVLNAISMLHRLGFDEQKIKISSTRR